MPVAGRRFSPVGCGWQRVAGRLSDMQRGKRTLVRQIWLWIGYVPRGTRVDPADFPEDDYPVHCLTCGYALRGSPDGCCPECGSAFVRGHLLVEAYARGRRPKTDPYRRAVSRLLTVSLVINLPILMLYFGLGLAARLAPEPLAEFLFTHDLGPAMTIVLAICGVGIVASFVAMGILFAMAPAAKKRLAVEKAAWHAVRERRA
jgi:hypothetical protein